MDLKIRITDENDDELDLIQIYQDGSDREGATTIRSFLELTFEVEDHHIVVWCPDTGARETFEDMTPGNRCLEGVVEFFAEEHDLCDGNIVFVKRKGEELRKFRVKTETSVHYCTEPA